MINHYLDIIYYKVYADLRADMMRNYLGLLWWFVEPIMFMTFFYLVFSVIFHRGGPDFIVFLFIGLTVFKWFASGVVQMAGSINANKPLMQQVYLHKIIFPLIALASSTVKFGMVFSVLMVFLIVYGTEINNMWWFLPILIVIQFLVIAAIGSFIASFVPMIPDVLIVLNNVVSLLFFMSGVFFDINKLSAKYGWLIGFNPMAIIIDSYRKVLLYGEFPDFRWLSVYVLVASLVLFVSIRLINKYDKYYTKL